MSKPSLKKAVAAEAAGRGDPKALVCRLEECWDESVPWEHALRQARGALQGAWFCASGRREAELLVCGSRFAVRLYNGDIYMGTFDLNPVGRPCTMVMHIEEGPDRYKGQTAQCLYGLEGDALRWCATTPGRGEHLTDFPAEDDPNYLCLLFRRERAL
jgi:uncharacterized protein (TIGR03067 family)